MRAIMNANKNEKKNNYVSPGRMKQTLIAKKRILFTEF
jgi:hypothetical protein